jgi:hypothetical protein
MKYTGKFQKDVKEYLQKELQSSFLPTIVRKLLSMSFVNKVIWNLNRRKHNSLYDGIKVVVKVGDKYIRYLWYCGEDNEVAQDSNLSFDLSAVRFVERIKIGYKCEVCGSPIYPGDFACPYKEKEFTRKSL